MPASFCRRAATRSRCSAMPASVDWSAASRPSTSVSPSWDRQPRQQLLRLLGVLVDRQPEAEAELGVVLEERVRPRRAAPVGVDRVGRRRQVAAVDRRAAGGIGDERAVAEELGEQLDVRRLAAAGAGPGVLEERLEELRALDVELDLGPVDLRQAEEEGVVLALRVAQRALRLHVDRLVLRVRLVLGRADHDAQRAAGAVLGRDLDRVLHALELVALEVDRLEGRRRVLQADRTRRPWRGWPRAGRPSRTCCTGCRWPRPRPGSPARCSASPTAPWRSARCRRRGRR